MRRSVPLNTTTSANGTPAGCEVWSDENSNIMSLFFSVCEMLSDILCNKPVCQLKCKGAIVEQDHTWMLIGD